MTPDQRRRWCRPPDLFSLFKGDFAVAPKPAPPHTPEQQAMAQRLGIDLANIDWSKIVDFLQLLAELLAKKPPPTA